MDHIKTTQAMYAALAVGDLGSLVASTAPDVEWGGSSAAVERACPFLRRGRGHDAVRGFFGGVADAMTHERFVPRAILSNGDEVVSVIEMDFVARATGKRASIIEVHVFRFDAAGKIAKFTLFTDEPAVLAAFQSG